MYRPDAIESGAVPAAASEVAASLKWFDAARGFGFVILSDRGADAFLHATALKRAGLRTVAEGDRLLCRIEQGPRGMQVREVVSLLEGKASAAAPDAGAERLTGTVKWYRPEKGFGFVAADDGGKDIFLHKKCLERYGLETINRLVPIEMTVRDTPRGREVVEFSFLE